MQGIRVDKSRLRKEMSRQAAATVTTHHVHLFSCKLTSDEMDIARKCAEERTDSCEVKTGETPGRGEEGGPRGTTVQPTHR